ncbi:MAG: proteasome accessory factor PafA2 family protein [Oligoflexus sp.]
MSRRLFGQETELAIRFEPRAGVQHPGNKVIFEYLALAIKSIVHTKPGKRNFIQDQFFVENGGAVYYEHHPQSLRKGLIEFATPECASAHELILYQRAQERLMLKAIPLAQRLMANEGIEGELGLIKNSRDFEGNTYGCQENYDAEIAPGLSYVGMLLGLILYLPLSLASKLVYIVLLVPFVFMIFVAKVLLEIGMLIGNSFIGHKMLGGFRYLQVLVKRLSQWSQKLDLETHDTEEFLLRFEYHLFYPLFWLSYKPLIGIYNVFAFKKPQRAVEAFLLTRMMITGAGSLEEEGVFRLSEKSSAVTNRRRQSIHRMDKPLFDCGNLIKEYELAVWEMFLLRFESFRNLFARRQRFQVSFSDSNRCQFAEFLKLGLTGLVVRMADEGYLDDAPQINNPREALAIVSREDSLEKMIPLQNGGEMSVMDIQRWYLRRMQEIVKDEHELLDLEVLELLRLWEETLDRLASDPLSLIGRIDWITKKYLLSEAGGDLDFWARKKIDIRYHELGAGYFEVIQERGLTLDLYGSDEIEEAVTRPSSPKRVKLRSRLIKSLALQQKPMTVSWSQIKIGRWRPKVIRLDEFTAAKNKKID